MTTKTQPEGARDVAERLDETEISFDVMAKRLAKDVRDAAANLDKSAARFLVDYYYQVQHLRTIAQKQRMAAEKNGEPSAVLDWTSAVTAKIETTIKGLLLKWASQYPAGRWAIEQTGIGPVIAAGLIVHIDPERAVTAGDVWALAGLIPGQKRTRGEKANWNPRMKQIAWFIGQSFTRFKGLDSCWYGKRFEERWAYEKQRNESGGNADRAKHELASKNWRDDTVTRKALEAGRLSDGHILARAQRWTAKLFLSHFQQVLWETTFQKPCVKPWAIEHGGHAHLLAPPAYTPIK